MINNNSMVIFMLGLCPLIPAASNFAYGIIIASTVWILFFSGLFASMIADFIGLGSINKFSETERGLNIYANKLKYIFINLFIIFAASFFNFLLQGIFPIIQGALQIYIYITSFSYIVFLSLDDYNNNVESLAIPINYSILVLVFSLLRELFAFSSISVPSTSGLLSLHIPYFYEHSPFRFFGTTAGSCILLGITSWIFLSIKKGNFSPFRSSK